ncbi:MAG: extracellular solute-binding protein [Paenibacillaceae bacterium]|nr:extracellular solute-binding protein [Paenibacillaceae bacterium]
MRKKVIVVLLAGVLLAVAAFEYLIGFDLPAMNKQGEPSDKKKGEVTLHLVSWYPFSRQVLDLFHQRYPTITVENEQIDIAYYPDLIHTQMVSKSDMDIVWLYPNMLRQYFKMGALTDWSGRPWLNRYDEAAVDAGTVFGRVLGVPYNKYATVIFYNQDLFDRLHLSVPANWSELMDVSAKLQTYGVAPFVLGGKDAWMLQYLLTPRLAEIGDRYPGIYLKLQTGEKKWTDPEFHGLLDPYKDIVANHYALAKTAALGYDQVAAMFKEGKAAMWPMGSWAVERFSEEFRSFRVGMFPVPINRYGERPVVEIIANNFLTGMNWSRHPQELETFLQFLAEPEVAELYAQDTKSAVNLKGTPLIVGGSPVAMAALDRYKPVPMRNLSKSIEKTYLPYLQQIVLGQEVSEAAFLQALQAAQEKDNDE